MSQDVKQTNFTLEELPGVLYDKLNGILSGTRYQSLSKLSDSNHEQIVLVSKYHPDLWIDINDGTVEGKSKGTFDLYHLEFDSTGNEIRIPHLRIFNDQLFDELKIRYL